MKIDPNVVLTFVLRYTGIAACAYIGWAMIGPWIDRIIPG
jgi:hypothetical protein